MRPLDELTPEERAFLRAVYDIQSEKRAIGMPEDKVYATEAEVAKRLRRYRVGEGPAA